MSQRVALCSDLGRDVEQTPTDSRTDEIRADLGKVEECPERVFGRFSRVENQAGERAGVADASPARLTADGNADRTRVFHAFTLPNP